MEGSILSTDQSEKEIENTILEFLERSPGCLFYKNNNGGVYDTQKAIFRKNQSRFIPNGASDLYGSFYSIASFTEVKTPKEYTYIMKNYGRLKGYFGDCKKQSRYRDQIFFIETNRSQGNIAFFAESVDRVKEELGKAYMAIKKRMEIKPCL